MINESHNPNRETLRKSAKLRHRTLVRDLFEKGKYVYSGHLKVAYRALSEEELAASFRGDMPDLIGPVQMMITVPKKKRRHAVDRVLIRRRIRESFRRQWHALRSESGNDIAIRTVSLALIYTHNENDSYADIDRDMRRGLRKVARKLGLINEPCSQDMHLD